MAHTHTGYRIFAFAFSSYRCGLPWGFSSKESTCQGRRSKRHGFDPWVWKIPWRRSWQLMATHSSILPGESHGQRNLVGYSQKDHKELNMTEATQHIRVCVCVCVCVCVYRIFIHSSVSGHLCCFHVLATVNSDVMNPGEHVCFQIIVLSGYMPRSEISKSYGNSIFSF